MLSGVSGFKTKKASESKKDIFSNTLGKNGQPSGVWEHLPDNHERIAARVFLTHFEDKANLDKVVSLFVDKNGQCKKDLGLIILANSWGAWNANALGNSYFHKCGRLPDVFVMIDGITKPFFGTYTRPIWTYNCVNYFQTESELHGAAIGNCLNEEVRTGYSGMADAHVALEWSASERASILVKKYLDHELLPHWTKNEGVNYLKDLRDYSQSSDHRSNR